MTYSIHLARTPWPMVLPRGGGGSFDKESLGDIIIRGVETRVGSPEPEAAIDLISPLDISLVTEVLAVPILPPFLIDSFLPDAGLLATLSEPWFSRYLAACGGSSPIGTGWVAPPFSTSFLLNSSFSEAAFDILICLLPMRRRALEVVETAEETSVPDCRAMSLMSRLFLS